MDLSGNQGAFHLVNQFAGSNVPRNLFDPMYEASKHEDLSTKPSAQADFVKLYPKGFQPLANAEAYHRFYYQLQKEVDEQSTVCRDCRNIPDALAVGFLGHGCQCTGSNTYPPKVTAIGLRALTYSSRV